VRRSKNYEAGQGTKDNDGSSWAAYDFAMGHRWGAIAKSDKQYQKT
jgi:hypothetical protein